MMLVGKYLLKFILIALASITAFLAIFGVMDFFDVETDRKGGSIGMIVVFGPLTVFFIYLLFILWKQDEKKSFSSVLNFLKTEKKVTPAEVAVGTDIPARKAKIILEDMCDMGLLEKHLTEMGNILYSLNVLTSEEKLTSRKPNI